MTSKAATKAAASKAKKEEMIPKDFWKYFKTVSRGSIRFTKRRNEAIDRFFEK